MRKIVSVFIIICVLYSNICYAGDIGFNSQARGNINLSPPLKLDDIVDNSLALAIMWLTADLEELDSIKDIDNATDIEVVRGAFYRKRHFRRSSISTIPSTHPKAPKIRIISYFNQLDKITQLASHIFSVPVSVEKGGKRKDYKLLFSTVRKKGSSFPVVFLAEEDLKRLKTAIKARDALPERDEEKKRAIERYIQHEEVIDKVIKYAHENGLAQKPLESKFNYKETVRRLLKDLNVNVSNPNTLTPIEDRELYLVELIPEIRKMIQSLP